MDLISRQAAIDAVLNIRQKCDMNDIDDYRDILVECFEELPTAEITLEQVEEYCRPRCLLIVAAEFFHAMMPTAEKRGKWLPLGEGWACCSVCENLERAAGLRWRYCPHCGARMEESDG